MLAKELKKGDIFTVDGYTDPESPARECLSAHSEGKGIRFGFPGNDRYWCFMGESVEVTLVDAEATTDIPEIECLTSAEVSNVVKVGIVDLPNKCLHCGANIEEAGLTEWNWKDVGYGGGISAGEFRTDGFDFDGDSFHPSEYRCAQCHKVLNDFRRDNVAPETRKTLKDILFAAVGEQEEQEEQDGDDSVDICDQIESRENALYNEISELQDCLEQAIALLPREALKKFFQAESVKEILSRESDQFEEAIWNAGLAAEQK